MELSLSRSLPGSKSFVLRQFLCSISKTVSSPDPHFALVDARSRLAVAPTLRRAPPLSGHTLTASRATARLRGRDNDQRGARYRARFNRATTLYPVGPRTRTMMQSCASAAKLRSGGPILPVGVKAKGLVGAPPPRTVIGAPSQACGQGRNYRHAFSVLRSLCRTHNDAVRDKIDRIFIDAIAELRPECRPRNYAGFTRRWPLDLLGSNPAVILPHCCKSTH